MTADAVFVGSGTMAEECRSFEWALTPLGPVENWPTGMRSIANLALASPFPSLLLLGPALVIICNDAFASAFEDDGKHILGLPASEAYSDRWEVDAPLYNYVWQGHPYLHVDTMSRFHHRGVEASDTQLNIGYSPVRDDVGSVCGVLLTICPRS